MSAVCRHVAAYYASTPRSLLTLFTIDTLLKDKKTEWPRHDAIKDTLLLSLL